MAYHGEPGEVRRIIRVGPKSYALILPKRWLQERGLGPGDNLVLYTADDYILVVPLGRRRGEAAPTVTPELVVNRELLEKMALTEDAAVSCSYLMGFNAVLLKGFRESDVVDRLSSYPWVEVEPGDELGDSVVMRFVIKESSYNEKMLLRLMLREILALMEGVAKSLLSAETPSLHLEDTALNLRKYGYLLARRLLSYSPGGPLRYGITYFSAGLILGLLGELMLSMAYSFKKRPPTPRAGYIMSMMIDRVSEIIQEALNALIYTSARRCRRSKKLYEKYKRALRLLKHYSRPGEELEGFIAWMDSLTRISGKLVEGCQCLMLSSLTK